MSREPLQKRRRGNAPRGGFGNKPWDRHAQTQHNRHQHWDEPSQSSATLSYDPPAPTSVKKDKPKRYTINHELSQEDLWDDSALIQAWDAAAEEYASLNGPGKSWKDEPTHKSALWYAPPPKPEGNQADDDDDEEEGENEEGEADAEENGDQDPDSIPIDFDSFVPAHDPTLGQETSGAAAYGPYAPTSLSAAAQDVSTLSKDDIFEKAVSASYWAGYWTAMYHAKSVKTPTQVQADKEAEEADDMVRVEGSG